ncbi:hypothetical protein [Halocatena pleomorpha]|uniref:Uncharacterized protein n=1 Tax=Halocatena pleomorpha TaxID=1785090 RepID=A0A3P3R837_9EURY|nr:hypothetical protein [Halocatena pleomorpha]RRJ29535.1 hypothetical protein EIK79_12930 [Halocatena pleomorpha]
MIKRVLNNSFYRRQLLLSSVIGPLQKRIRGADGVYITDTDWDNLIILDGCRFDLFNQVRAKLSLDGELTKRQSRGSASPEFLKANFDDRSLTDTVYVTANPFEKWVLDEPFLYTDRVWTDGWDETEETVLPETLADRTRTVHDEYPNKRLIAHFMQPHVPFVGETRVNVHSDNMEEFRNMMLGSDGDGEFSLPVWEALSTGQLETELVWEAYRDNLLCVLETALPLAEDLPGKTVITADHGNSFGEWATPFPIPVYFHPRNVRIPSLIEVPWFIPPYEERKSIIRSDENITTAPQSPADTTSKPTEDTAQTADESVVEDRLSALGYTE